MLCVTGPHQESCEGRMFKDSLVSLFAAPTLIIPPPFYTSMYKIIRDLHTMTSNMDSQDGNVIDNRGF